MSRQPFLILSVCFILGIFFQDKLGLDENLIYFAVCFCVIILLSTFFKTFFLHKIKPVLSGLLYFGAGIVLHFFNTFSHESVTISSNKEIVFKISKKLNSTEKYKKYESVVKVGEKYFPSVLYIPKSNKELDFIHYYKAESYITEVKSPVHDFQFDYAQYLKRRNIEYQCYVSGEISSVLRNDVSLSEKVSQKRFEVLQHIDHTDMSSQSKEFLKGIILADRTEIDSSTIKDFNRTGLVHFLAISGTHIVIIFGLFYFAFTRFLPLKLRTYAVILSLILIWLFAGFIGFGNSVLRSCIMLSVYFIYVLLQRKPDLLHSLGLSAFIILALDTQQIFDVGFQLSFAAVLGIFWLNQPILNHFPNPDTYFKKLLFNTVSISVAAQLATLPLVLYYFHQFSFVSIVANFFIVPFSELIIVFSFVMTIFIAFRMDFQFINMIYDALIQFLLKAIHWFAGFDKLFFENVPLNLVEVMALFVIVYLLRFVIIKLNFRHVARFVISVLTFLIIRIGFNIVEAQKEEVLVHDFYKHKIFSVKKGRTACFWISDLADIKSISQYIINPYSASRRLEKVEVKVLPSAIESVVYHNEIYKIN